MASESTAAETGAPAAKLSDRRKRRAAEILVAARDLFLEKGFEKTAVADIAQKVGVVEGLVFSYFPTKRDLLHEVLRALYVPLIRDVEEGYKRLDGLRSRLRFLVWRHLRVYLETPSMAKLVLHEVRSGPEYFSSGLHDLHVRYTQPLVNTLRDAIAAEELPPHTSVELIRSTMYGGIEHQMWPVLFGRAQVNLETVTDQFTDILLHGMLGPPNSAHVNSSGDADMHTRLARLESMVTELHARLCATPSASTGKKRKS